MCTWLTKIRGDTVLRLEGIECCLSVEDVEMFDPEISRANGWLEVFVDQKFPGKTEIWVPLGDDVLCKFKGIKAAGMLEYRGRTVHFINRERVTATRDYIAAKQRCSSDYPEHRGFLENLPSEFLKGSARGKVVGLLDRVIRQIGMTA